MKRSDMYGNRGVGRFGGQQGFLGNPGMLMASPMPGLAAANSANMQMSNQGGGQREMWGGSGMFQMNPSLGMREMQQQGGMNISNRMNPQAQDAVLDILPRRSTSSGMRRGGYGDTRGQLTSSFSPPMKRSRTSAIADDDDMQTDDRRSGRGRFKCQVCRLQFASIDEFDEHMGSEGHATNMKVMSAVYHDKNQQILTSSVNVQNKKNSGSGNSSGRDRMCPVCERTFGPMSEMDHRQTQQHKHREFLVKKGCLLCGVKGFQNYPAYVKHIDSAEHKQKKRDLSSKSDPAPKASSLVKSFVSQSDSVRSLAKKTDAKKEAAVVQKLSPAEKRANIDDLPSQSESASPPCDIAESTAIDIDDPDDLVYDPDIALGVDHVISVTGYFCKLCHKFYNNETMARITHCKSQAHFDKFIQYQRKKLLEKSLSSSLQEHVTSELGMMDG